MFLNIFKKKKVNPKLGESTTSQAVKENKAAKVAVRKGEIGEYKIDIQLDQLPRGYKYISDIMLKNPKSISGYSQIDHIVLTPFGIFVIETKNYQGTIYGGKNRKEWLVNGKFKMMNPFVQNLGHIQVLRAMIDSKFENHFFSLVSFTKRCTFRVDEELRKISSNELIVYDIELSEFIHRKVSVLKLQNKSPILTDEEIEDIYFTIEKANIQDPEQRELHNQTILQNKAKKDIAVANNATTSKCSKCQTPVSDKIAAFCLSNKKFQGEIYCYIHQKDI